jgi:hypothetical protein
MNLTALSGPEPTIGPGILAAAPAGPPFALPLSVADDTLSNATLPSATNPLAVPAFTSGGLAIAAEDCPPPQVLPDESLPSQPLAAQKAATRGRASGGPAETVTSLAPASPQPSTSSVGTIEIPPFSNGEEATGAESPKQPSSPDEDRDPCDAEAPENRSVPVPEAHQPASRERSVHSHAADRPGLERVRSAEPRATPKDDGLVQPASVPAALSLDAPPGNKANAANPSGSKPAEGDRNETNEADTGEPQVIDASSTSKPAATDASPTPLQSAASFAHTPTARTAHAATEASSQAPGLDRADKSPPASPRAVELRSDRAAERIADTPPINTASVAPDDSGVPINRPPPPHADTAAPTTQPVLSASPQAQRDAALATEPAPRLHLASPRFAEEVGIAIARRPGGLTPGDELVLQIEPANMGRIRVELRFAPDGALEAVLSADHQRVLEQLRAHGADLHRCLIEAGGRADIAPPRFEARPDNNAGFPTTGGQTASGGQGQAGQQQGHGQHHARATTPYLLDPATPTAPSRLRPMSATGRLDLIA